MITGCEEEVRVTFVPSSAPSPVFRASVEVVRVPEATQDGGILVPWWDGVALERVASGDGIPLPGNFVASYQRLLTNLEDLVDSNEMEEATAYAAASCLKQAMFAGAAPPRLSWHGMDAVVLFWTAGHATSFFTITAEDISFLKEDRGQIVDRRDAMPSAVWSMVFPLSYSRH